MLLRCTWHHLAARARVPERLDCRLHGTDLSHFEANHIPMECRPCQTLTASESSRQTFYMDIWLIFVFFSMKWARHGPWRTQRIAGFGSCHVCKLWLHRCISLPVIHVPTVGSGTRPPVSCRTTRPSLFSAKSAMGRTSICLGDTTPLLDNSLRLWKPNIPNLYAKSMPKFSWPLLHQTM